MLIALTLALILRDPTFFGETQPLKTEPARSSIGTIVIGKCWRVCVEELELPVRPLQFLAGLLPKQARRELERRGLNTDVLLNDTIPT